MADSSGVEETEARNAETDEMEDSSTILAIDFETVSETSWFACACVVLRERDRKIVDTFEAYTVPDQNAMDGKRQLFWREHRHAMNYMLARARGTREQHERELVRFMWRHTDAVLVGDHPAFDYALLNGICRRHDAPSVFAMHPRRYRIPVCVRTMRRMRPDVGLRRRAGVHTPLSDALFAAETYLAIKMASPVFL